MQALQAFERNVGESNVRTNTFRGVDCLVEPDVKDVLYRLGF